MSNHYFKFKQFTVHQEHCAMKVSTDACIQGAWTPLLPGTKTVLDIGTGTGLLSLMLAQRAAGIQIDGVELDPGAAAQAVSNTSAAPWKERINIVNADAREYPFKRKYDLIICNPPFFSKSLLGPDITRNTARHTLSFSFTDLFSSMEQWLLPTGYASVLLPAQEYELWLKIITENGWSVFHTLEIIPAQNVAPNRIVSLCGHHSSIPVLKEKITIRGIDGSYTHEFTDLLQPFYLKL